MKKVIVTAAIIASVCGVFSAREILAENTTRHAVQKGDTLWDLSGGYLNDPLLWPKIWKMNPSIANPHRIMPGQIVTIPGLAKTSSRKASTEAAPASAPGDSDISALARAGLASFSEPLPLTVVKKGPPSSGEQAEVSQREGSISTRYYEQGIGMVTNEIPNLGRVVRAEQGWHGAALGESILISAPGAQVGQQFGVYRDLGKVAPLSYFGTSPGHLLADIAIVEIVASDPARQQAVIRSAFAEVRAGDVLGQVPQHPAVSPRPVAAGTSSVKGSVVAFHFMRRFAGPDDIVYLNIGADQGLLPGDLLSVAEKDQAEGRDSGEIMILRVSATTAAAVVTKRSSHEVRRGDVVGPPVL